VKLVHLVGFITNKFVMMQGHMNVKFLTEKLWNWADGVYMCVPQFTAVFRILNLCLEIRQLQLLVDKQLTVCDSCLCIVLARVLISIHEND
jgi:hypothetical protein